MQTIIIVDDHPLIRVAIRSSLESDYRVLAETGSGAHAIRLAHHHKPDLLILDLMLEDSVSGLEVIDGIHARSEGTKILVLTGNYASEVAEQCVNAGVSGLLYKTSDMFEIRRAIDAVLAGYAFFPMELLKQKQERIVGKIPDLSRRERQVMHLILRGKTNSEIADGLCLSSKTVSTHKTRMLQKLGLESVSNLFEYARKQGIQT
ncbi:Virulence factors putative positive transcription regulator BvgA [compost metagenome]|uniref:response regulator transcription factor n=1 Tax=Achromobacter sp. Root83 TaxID=1736602 RepID=UPI000710E3A1|nr:response regulator transcription factor [Achromobacter sp. Root83]KRC73044.1 hypothetical protein ASE30_09455 [Achromobacter sp. Root83]